MVSKIVTSVGRYAIKKIGNKTMEKAWDDYGNMKRKIINETLGVKPLNVGEDEEMACYRQYPNDTTRCRAVGDRIRDEYRRTGKYNPYSKKK